MKVFEKLMNVQTELKVPKSNYNSFGKYKYRSCEDILEAVKPVLAKHKASIVLSDSIEVNGDRTYIKATAVFYDTESGESIVNTAYARESAEKKGMDDAQVTGTSSSYARKYCLNGLLLIDDTKDDDTDEAHIEKEARADKAGKTKHNEEPKVKYISEKDQTILKNLCQKAGYEVSAIFPNGLNLTDDQYKEACIKLNGLIEKAKK